MRASETPLPFPTANFSGKTKLFVSNRRVQRRRMFRKFDTFSFPGFVPICCDTNDPNSLEAAYKKRLLRDLPDPDPEMIKRLAAFVPIFLNDNLVPLAQVGSFEDWLNGLVVPLARKEELAFANAQNRGGRPPRNVASKVDSFGKTEYYTTYKFGRMINSRCDRFKAYSGRFFKAIEAATYPLEIGGFNCFAKHLSKSQLAEQICAMRGMHKYTYSNDFTAYESHFTPFAMNAIECAYYKYSLASHPDDAKYICDVLTGINRMRMRNGTRAVVVGRRMSGDMCTSLGNGFTNLILAHFLASIKGEEIVGLVEGDDGLFTSDALLTEEDYAALGFSIKITMVDDPRGASFCGMLFSDDFEIIKDPVKTIVGLTWTHSMINAGDDIMMQLLRAKALSSVHETPQCPIAGALSRRALKVTEGVVPRFIADGYHKVPPDQEHLPEFHPMPSTRLLYEAEYGISVDDQLHIEGLITRGQTRAAASILALILGRNPGYCESIAHMADFERKYVVYA